MDKEKKDILSSEFRKRLENYELPVRKNLWAEIEQDLSPKKKIVRPLWKHIGSVAASIALILSLSWGIFNTLNKTAKDTAQLEMQKEQPGQTNLQQIVHESVEPKVEAESEALMKGSPKPLYASTTVLQQTEVLMDEKEIPSEYQEVAELISDSEKELPEESIFQPVQEKKNEILLPPADPFADDFDVKNILSPKKNDLSFALAYSNQGSSSNPDNKSLRLYNDYFPNVDQISFTPEAEVSSPLNNVVISDTKYKMPVIVSFSVRKPLNNRWAAESGLSYTYLESSKIWTYSGEDSYSNTYELHYIGVPLKMSYSIYNRGNWSAYVSGGGMIEKCIFGQETRSTDRTKEKLDIPELQWSISGNVGVSYKIFKQLNLFVEPGVSYYFDDKNDIPTIRKDKPFNFNLQLGLRLDI